MPSNKLATAKSVTDLVNAHAKIRSNISLGYASLKNASVVYNEFLNDRPYPSHFAAPQKDEETLLKELKVCTWRYIFSVTGSEKLLSTARKKEFGLQ